MGRNILSMAFKQSETKHEELQIVLASDAQGVLENEAQDEHLGGLVGAFKVQEAPKTPNGEEAPKAQEAPPKAEMSFLWIVATGIAMVLLI